MKAQAGVTGETRITWGDAPSGRRVVSSEEWMAERVALLEKEKEFTRLRDELGAQLRSLPWERVTKDYVFEGAAGPVGLGDLFGTRSQLLVYHFMFDESWDEGCKSCSLVTDGLAASAVHLAARDVAVVLVSRASLGKLRAFRERMGWKLDWVSSAGSDFNSDFQASAAAVNQAGEYRYNYRMTSDYPDSELPGLSVFARDGAGGIFHTYSAYARGLETFMGVYRFLDAVPKGRDEDDLSYGMAWVRHHDRYAPDESVGR
jgi:predicted dithiol-disulfide oxidoreductase (DUF899 family)